MKKQNIAALGVFCLVFICFLIYLPKQSAAAEKYPTRAIKFVVPYAAGGQTDVVCRKIVYLAKEALGHEMIVDNKVGASGLVTASFLAKAKPDGYTIGAIPTTPFLVSPNYSKIDFDPVTAFTALGQIFTGNQMLAVGGGASIKTFKEFAEEAHKRQVTVATTGLGPTEVALRRLAVEAKLNLRIVPFEGSAPAVMAVMGGQMDAFAGGGSYEYIKAGKIKVIARFTALESGSVKGAPSLKELGYNIEAIEFLGIFGPKGLPEPIEKRLESEFSKALHDPSVVQLIDNVGSTAVYRNGRDFAEYIKKAYDQSKKEFQELGLGIYAKDKK